MIIVKLMNLISNSDSSLYNGNLVSTIVNNPSTDDYKFIESVLKMVLNEQINQILHTYRNAIDNRLCDQKIMKELEEQFLNITTDDTEIDDLELFHHFLHWIDYHPE